MDNSTKYGLVKQAISPGLIKLLGGGALAGLTGMAGANTNRGREAMGEIGKGQAIIPNIGKLFASPFTALGDRKKLYDQNNANQYLKDNPNAYGTNNPWHPDNVAWRDQRKDESATDPNGVAPSTPAAPTQPPAAPVAQNTNAGRSWSPYSNLTDPRGRSIEARILKQQGGQIYGQTNPTDPSVTGSGKPYYWKTDPKNFSEQSLKYMQNLPQWGQGGTLPSSASQQQLATNLGSQR
jgi:hypothetical protein